ncbi:MAG: hypothetical protein M0R48_01120 [Candidatus Omnitrophica bacterium]|jgi:hypothetical protein|nr:hypothetical protein [Candidatus Omnitrophota bacterium]
MLQKGVLVLLLAVFGAVSVPVSAKNLTETEVIAVAKDALTGKAIAFEDAVVTYDKDNQKWIGWGEVIAKNPSNPNYGNLPYGVLNSKKYHTVYFDFDETKRNDIWVFVDADTGDALTVYEEK